MVETASKNLKKKKVIVLASNAIYSVSMQNFNKSEEKKKESNFSSVSQNRK